MGEVVVHRPLGDLFEEMVNRGADRWPGYLVPVPTAPAAYRISVLLAALVLGREVSEVIQGWVPRPDSPAKRGFFLGLGALGHPAAAGYLARLVRERGAVDAIQVALVGLGRIGRPEDLPRISGCLGDPFLHKAASGALADFGTREAGAALLAHGDDPDVLAALAALGEPDARDRFVAALHREAPWAALGARGIGQLGDPGLTELLLPHVEAVDGDLARAAFEAAAALAGEGAVAALLGVARERLEPWMIPAMARLGDAEIHEFLFGLLASEAPGGWFRRWLRRRAEPVVDPLSVCAALRGAREPGVVDGLLERLTPAAEPGLAREILQNQGLAEEERYAPGLGAVWAQGGTLVKYLVARTALQVPDAAFLGEALALLGRPGLVELDGAPGGMDEEHLARVHGAEINPFLLVGEFLDTGLVDLEGFEKQLCERFARGAHPSDDGPRLDGLGEADYAMYLSAVCAARPERQSVVRRLWGLFAQLDDRGDPVLDLLVAWEGFHRGPVQRAVVRGFPAALGRWVQGRTDRDLPLLDEVAGRVPREGPLVGPVNEWFDRARVALQAECRDMVLMVEGGPRGDMVLIEML